jgi:nucleoid DNA-binding protein
MDKIHTNSLAKKYNISPKEVENIIESHIKFLKHSIGKEVHAVRIPYIGHLKLNKTALEKVKSKKNESTES